MPGAERCLGPGTPEPGPRPPGDTAPPLVRQPRPGSSVTEARSSLAQRGSEPRPEGAAGRLLHVQFPGSLPYARSLEMQEELVRRRRAGEIPDQLLLLEHPHVITMGTSARAEHLRVSDAERRRLGIELFHTGRGGDVTYHGPGQLVGYPILDLNPDRRDLHRYLRDLEQVLIDTLDTFGIRGERKAGLTGVWVHDAKIAAIGVRVSSGWITSHGFALNVNTDLAYFRTIVPCGIAHLPVTSMARELGHEIPLRAVGHRAALALARQFERELAVV